MNETNRQILGIYMLALLIEDTLEYALPSYIIEETVTGVHDLKKYEHRKQEFQRHLQNDSAIMVFCGNNFRNENIGAVLIEKVVKFGVQIYGIETKGRIERIVSVIDDRIEIAQDKISELIDTSLGLHEILTDIIDSYIAAEQNSDNISSSILDLLHRAERFYRDQAMFTVSANIASLYAELSHLVAMKIEAVDDREAEKIIAEDGDVKLIEKRISDLFGNANFVLEHNKCEDVAFQALINKYHDLRRYFSGDKKIESGKSFISIINEFQNIFTNDLKVAGTAWQECYARVKKEMLSSGN